MYLLTDRRGGLGVISLPAAIFRQEGSTDAAGNWNTASLGYRLNNPGNLNYAGQPGCHPTTLGNGMEAQCDTLEAGIAATDRQLALDASRGLTLAQRLQTWATGNPSAYVANVSSWTGYDPSTPLSAILSGSVDASIPLDSSPTIDSSASSDGSGGGIGPGAVVGLAAAVGLALLAWMAG